jgi:hypothetical protein
LWSGPLVPFPIRTNSTGLSLSFTSNYQNEFSGFTAEYYTNGNFINGPLLLFKMTALVVALAVVSVSNPNVGVMQAGMEKIALKVSFYKFLSHIDSRKPRNLVSWF